MEKLPSDDPTELGLPDNQRARSLIRTFFDYHTQADVYNEQGEITVLLLDLAKRYRLDLRQVDLAPVDSLEDMYKALGTDSESDDFRSSTIEERKPGLIITGMDNFVLNHPHQFSPFRDLDMGMRLLSIAAQYGAFIVVTHPEDRPVFMKYTYPRLNKIADQSHWLKEFLYVRFVGKTIE